jgi:hypothetical protein
MNLAHMAYFFQIIGIIGLLQVNPLQIETEEDSDNFWKARKIYWQWEEAQG